MHDLQTDRATRINDLHRGIEDKLRTSVADAIEIGRELADQKAELRHGDFLLWLKVNACFSQRAAYNYMGAYDHRDKIANVANLSQAYAMVEDLEAQERRAEKRRVQAKVEEHKAIGTKPLKKDDRPVYEEYRKQEATEEVRAGMKREQDPEQSPPSIEEINRVLEAGRLLNEQLRRDEKLNLATYADTANQRSMFFAIERYINSFDTNSERLEATHNLIKKLRLIANSLQQESVL